MKKLILPLTLALLIASCGSKDETQSTPPQDQQYTQQQTQQQPQSTSGNEQDQTKKDVTVKEEEKKKEDEKKKENEKKKEEMKKGDEKIKEDDKTSDSKTKDEDTKKTEDLSSKENKTGKKKDIDFAKIFSKRCAKCHGKDLKGKPDGGPDLTRSETQNKSDKELFKIITNGVEAENEEDEDMPSFKKKLSEEEIRAAIKFIKEH